MSVRSKFTRPIDVVAFEPLNDNRQVLASYDDAIPFLIALRANDGPVSSAADAAISELDRASKGLSAKSDEQVRDSVIKALGAIVRDE